jgi:hypothetical protein
MRKLITLLTLLILIHFTSSAQKFSVSGTVINPDEKTPVKNAVVALLTPKDSILARFTRSDAQGKYILKDIAPGEYILMTTHPYFADLMDNVTVSGNMEIPQLALLSKVKLLQEVIIKTGSPIKIRGDTTVYTADSFKVSANANVEELLKKLPGIQVDKDGKIKAMGETVQKVLVDGEEFFGDDPGMAVKNLRADAVKEVRVFDKKSDQAEFTGIDDGKTQKTIDLRLKEDKKTGYFGKIDAAGGLQKNIAHRYNDNLLFSSFKGKRKFSGYFLNGNTGQDGLSWQDEQKYGGGDNMTMSMDDDGGIMIIGGGRSNDDEPYLDPQNGFITNVNAGISYNNKWTDAHTLNFSPKFTSQDYANHKRSFTQTQLSDSVLNDNSDAVTKINRYNIKNRLTYDLKLDSNNTLRVTANANFYHSESNDVRSSESRGGSGTLKNSSNRTLETNSDKSAVSGNLLFKHKFKKARRTLSISTDWNVLNSEGQNILKSTNQSYFGGLPAGSQKLNQMKDFDQSTKSISAKFVYTEPLSKEYSLELGYQLSYNFGTNDQLTYSFSSVSGKYDIAVDSLSNQFKQNILQNIPSAKINFSNKKFKINVGSGFGFTSFELKDLSFNKDYNRNYVNFFPTGNIVYTYKPNHSIRMNYNGNTRQPSLNQLQPLRNNNDYFNQYIGNPDLKPSFTNSFNLSHNSYNFIKDIYTYLSVNARMTHNSITTNRTINVDSGKTTSQPVNTNGNYSMGLYGGSGFKIKKIDTRVNMGPNFNYSRYVDVINSKESFSKNYNIGFNLGLNKSKEKKYDLSLQNELGYNISNTAQNNITTHYLNSSLRLDATVYIKKVWSLRSDYQYNYRQKTQQFSKSINNNFWNARLQRTFKQDEFTAYFLIRDILNQNIGIDRSFNSNRYTETINDRLKRYFMIGFTWDFKNKAPKPTPTNN